MKDHKINKLLSLHSRSSNAAAAAATTAAGLLVLLDQSSGEAGANNCKYLFVYRFTSSMWYE